MISSSSNKETIISQEWVRITYIALTKAKGMERRITLTRGQWRDIIELVVIKMFI